MFHPLVWARNTDTTAVNLLSLYFQARRTSATSDSPATQVCILCTFDFCWYEHKQVILMHSKFRAPKIAESTIIPNDTNTTTHPHKILEIFTCWRIAQIRGKLNVVSRERRDRARRRHEQCQQHLHLQTQTHTQHAHTIMFDTISPTTRINLHRGSKRWAPLLGKNEGKLHAKKPSLAFETNIPQPKYERREPTVCVCVRSIPNHTSNTVRTRTFLRDRWPPNCAAARIEAD